MTLIRRKVRGTFLSTDGKRLRGRVTFTPAVTVYDAAGNVVLMKRPITANPDADGVVEVDLPITDDPRHTPTGWYYTVIEAFDDGPSRAQYWLEVPEGSGTIPLADAITDQIPPKPDYALIPGPQGDAATITVGTVTTSTPAQNPTVVNSGTVNDAVLDFGLPRARNVTVGATTVLNNNQNPVAVETVLGTGDKRIDFSLPQAKDVEVGTVTPVNPDQNPAVSNSGDVNTATLDFSLPRAAAVTVEDVTVVNPDQPPTITDVGINGDVDLEFEIPRAPTFAVGTVTTGSPGSSATVTDVGANGDVELDFSIPEGLKGDTGLGIEEPIGADGTLLAAQSGNVSGTEWVDEVTVDAVTLDTAAAETTAEAKLIWNADEGTAELGLAGAVPLFIGQNAYYRVKNQTGSPITKGTVCAFAGTLGASGLIKAKPADIATDGIDTVMGLAAATIADGGDGFVVAFGKLKKANTNAFNQEDLLWVDPTTPGGMTNVEPARPRVLIAAVVYKDGTNGEFVVRPSFDHTIDMDELADVAASSPNDGDILRYNTTSGDWESQALPEGVSLGLVLALGG